MDTNEYRWCWLMLRKRREELQRAIDFYNKSPDGQYDELASIALRAVLEQMRRDDRAIKEADMIEELKRAMRKLNEAAEMARDNDKLRELIEDAAFSICEAAPGHDELKDMFAWDE